jgi:PST family polysaccharide transporter
MKIVAAMEVITKCAAAAGVFVFVHRPDDAWRVLGLQAAASVLSTGCGLGLAYRQIAMRMPTPRLVGEALRTGWTMFLFRSSAMLYTTGNSFLLGLFAPPVAVGYFAGAEKISKAFMGLLNPLNQALYPRLSHLARHNPKEGSQLLRINALLVAICGVMLGVAVYVFAPQLVRILLGPQLAPAIPVLRLLAILPPLIGMNTVLSTQWMAPLGMDGTLNGIICGAGLLNVGLAVILAPRYREMGMACAVIGAELFIALTASVILARRSGRSEPLATTSLRMTDLESA